MTEVRDTLRFILNDRDVELTDISAARTLLATLRWALGPSPVRRAAEDRCAIS